MAKAKAKTTSVDPRLVTMGSIVRTQDDKNTEVVRSVSVVLHLANGMNETYVVGEDEVTVVQQHPAATPPEALVEQPPTGDQD